MNDKQNITKAPFTDNQVVEINKRQSLNSLHPYTCCSPEYIGNCERRKGLSEGVLIASNHSLICPCGEYKQDWVLGSL